MDKNKFSNKITRKFGEFPLLIVIDFLRINQQLLMLNMNKLIRTKLLTYQNCKVLKFYNLALKKNILQIFKINSKIEIDTQLNKIKFKEFMNDETYKIEEDEMKKNLLINVLSETDKFQIEETLLLKFLNTIKKLLFDYFSEFKLYDFNHITELVKLSPLSTKPTGLSLVKERVIKILLAGFLLKKDEFRFEDLNYGALTIIAKVLAILPVTNIALECVFSVDRFKILFEALKINPHLQKIDFSYLTSNGGVLEIMFLNFLKNNNCLKEITISTREEDGVDFLANIIKSNSTLQKIKFSCPIPFSEKEGTSLAVAIENNNSLLSLMVCNIYVDNCIIYSISKALKINSTLQEIIFSRCDITSEGCKFLGEMLKKNKTLQKLSLLNNNTLPMESNVWRMD